MPELTLESLAARVAELERKLAAQSAGPSKLDWLSVVGISDDNEFTRAMLAEMEAASEAERQAALEEPVILDQCS
jgi:hypothetical protein